ncbi:uncharacterized protein DFL_000474 [Arthrobotrys flagrans]|uniref:Uncharacterized protein n=1 Tax=Arthrobotrys flagrans TaxID=97331 RepID=A0A437AF69_ARTFL|nr:hypothetical protein DFL_000474 [Arthrobotrys flagrans]
MKFYRSITPAGCAPTPVDKASDAAADTETPSNRPDPHACLFRKIMTDCFEGSDCGGETMGCRCIVEAIERSDPSLGKEGLPSCLC